jgi:hypothetical protein
MTRLGERVVSTEIFTARGRSTGMALKPNQHFGGPYGRVQPRAQATPILAFRSDPLEGKLAS